MMRFVAAGVGGLLLIGAVSAALADDVTDQINEALKAYQKKDYVTASAALDAAASLLRQMKGDSLKTVLPDALSGWEAGEVEVSAMGAAMMGGATTVTRRYTKGDEHVEISILSDSPMVQGMAALFTAAASGPDNKLVIIDGRKVTYSKSENSYQTIVANKSLVKVEASKGVDDATLRNYVKGIKFAELEKAAQ
jgi:hypothetical protein